MVIYSKYLDPPEPPRHLWLEIDYSKINFNDMNQIRLIYTYVPETYTTLNNMYKIHKKNRKSYLDIKNKYDLYIKSPQIMKKFKKD